MTRPSLQSAVTLLALLALAGGAWAADRTPSPAGAEVYFVDLADHAKVHSPLVVHFGLKGMGIAPAGIVMENTGHHHLLVDVDGPLDPNEPIPSDKNHLHFGGGQTEVRLELPPGEHTLQLVLGDADHKLFKPPVLSRKIHITVLEVAEPAAAQATPRARAESSPTPRNR